MEIFTAKAGWHKLTGESKHFARARGHESSETAQLRYVEESEMNVARIWFVAGLCVLAAVTRLLPHPPNFTPLAAVALFGAATIPNRWWAIAVPIGSLLISDAVLQVTYLAGWQASWGFYQGQWIVYACILVTVAIGMTIRRSRSIPSVALATLASSLVFYVLTNFVYFYGDSSLYPRTTAGLLTCYQMALPFFRNSLAGDAMYTTLLFGALALAESRIPALRRQPAPRDLAVTAAS